MYVERYLSTSQRFIKEELDNFDYTDTESIIYNEYCNYSALMESTLDLEEHRILEAKIEVLQEITLKDIGDKFKKAWEWIKKQFGKLIDWIMGFIRKRRKNKSNNGGNKKVMIKGVDELKQKVISTYEDCFK